MCRPVDNEDLFIPHIYNYCDRWCERCAFTARCRVFSMEAELFNETAEIDDEAFVRRLVNILEDAKRMFTEKAAGFVDDEDEFYGAGRSADSAEYAAARSRMHEHIRSSELVRLAERYASEVAPLLEEDTGWAHAAPYEKISDEVLAVLHWYRFFIAAKLERAVSSNDGSGALVDNESDANGSAEIALIAIERSILSWAYLLDESNAELIRPLIRLLERIKLLAEDSFPHARDFVRPGFDEIDTVM